MSWSGGWYLFNLHLLEWLLCAVALGVLGYWAWQSWLVSDREMAICGVLLCLVCAVLLVWDVSRIVRGLPSVSSIVAAWGAANPLGVGFVGLVAGVLAGHFFWPVYLVK